MDLKHFNFTLKTFFCLLAVFSTSSFGNICSAPASAAVEENNSIGHVVATITATEGTVLTLTVNPDDTFILKDKQLLADKVLDYEAMTSPYTLHVTITCTNADFTINLYIIVVVQNINDNPPVFAQSQYSLEINELLGIGTSIERIEATDPDKDRLYYQLSPVDQFRLESEFVPNILVNKIVDYETTKEVSLTLTARDGPASDPSTHSASTSIKITILDVDNRPPWFQPCNETTIGSTKLCHNSGYSGTVTLTDQAVGPLPLKPGPIHAIDGDKGINAQIKYSILKGNDDGFFIIGEDSGDITVQKPVNVAGPIILTIMAYQVPNGDMYSINTLTIQVMNKSNNPPEFDKSSYEGFISEDAGVGSLVLQSKTSNKALQLIVKDADFADGKNPNIAFEILEDSAFRINLEGFIIMTKAAPPGTIELQVRVVDTTNLDSSTTSLSVEITPGVPTTTDMSTSPTTTDITTVTPITTDISTGATVTEATPNTDTSTTFPHTTSSLNTDEAGGMVGDYKKEDMAALGASLAIVLVICLVIIGVLVYYLRRSSGDWRKLSEASIFRSSLHGSLSGPKDGVQYTNEGFQHDRDTGSLTSKQAAELALTLGLQQGRKAPEQVESQGKAPTQSKNSGGPSADTGSLNELDNMEGDKEVKPILTKERKSEDGYKAVWFKQDIDPNVKEDVVIIPDRGEQDTGHEEDEEVDEDEDEDEEEEDEEDMDNQYSSTLQMSTDLDDEEGLTSDL